MTQHSGHGQGDDHDHDHDHGSAHDHGAELADLLDLDAEVLGEYLDEVAAWVEQQAAAAPRTIVDVGAGTGTGSLALARHFGAAEVVAIERSAVMAERLRAAALGQGLAARVRVVQADVDDAWATVGAADIVWAASSLHEFSDPDRVLRDIHSALRPGGLVVIVEMDDLPRFLPDDVGLGRPGLESRCHQALAQLGWNAHPDWRPHLERAGFAISAQRSFVADATPAPASVARYASAYLRRISSALHGRLATDDLDALDQLLSADNPNALVHRRELTVCGSRTAWAARRP